MCKFDGFLTAFLHEVGWSYQLRVAELQASTWCERNTIPRTSKSFFTLRGICCRQYPGACLDFLTAEIAKRMHAEDAKKMQSYPSFIPHSSLRYSLIIAHSFLSTSTGLALADEKDWNPIVNAAIDIAVTPAAMNTQTSIGVL